MTVTVARCSKCNKPLGRTAFFLSCKELKMGHPQDCKCMHPVGADCYRRNKGRLERVKA